MRTQIINYESNSLNTPDGNTDSGKDKRQYQEEHFSKLLKSCIERLTDTSNNDPINEAEILNEIKRIFITRFNHLIWQLETIDSNYCLISKKQRTGNEDYFLYVLQAEILKPLQLNIYNTPNNYLVMGNESDGIKKTKVISFLKQEKENLNRMESVNFTALINFLVGVTTNLFKLKP
jgi:hypothetical protein